MQEKSNAEIKTEQTERRSALETTSQYIWRNVDFACGIGVGLALAAFVFLIIHVHFYFHS